MTPDTLSDGTPLASLATLRTRRGIPLADLQQQAWTIAETHGHHEGLRDLSARDQLLIRCAYLHTEVSEIAEIAKKHGLAVPPAQLAEECADVLIYLAELCQQFGIDLETAVQQKMAINATRPYGYGSPSHPQKRTPEDGL